MGNLPGKSDAFDLRNRKSSNAASTATNGLPVGGSTGNVLVKNSGTNYDAVWNTLATAGIATASHTHGNITNAGLLTTAVTAGSTPKFVITDSTTNAIGTWTPTGSASSTTFLAGNGTWSTPAGTYSLPTATTSVLGGVKVDGTTITINGSGVISSSGGGGSLGWLGTTQTTASSGGTNSLTGVNTFTGATSGNIVMSTATVSGSGTQTSTNTTLATGNATGGLGAGGTVTSGNLTIKTGDATSDLTGTGGVSNPGNIYIYTGAPVYDSENGGANSGKVYVGTSTTGEVLIGNPNGTLGGASTVSIIPIGSSLIDKTVSIANDGKTATITLGTGSTTSSTIRLGTSATAVRIDLGNNNTSSATYHNGKNFFWQPDPTAVTSGSLLTVANLQTWILTTVSTSGSLQLPTGTNMDTISSFATSISFDWSLINTAGSGSVTITANGAGHTVYGNMAVAGGTSGRFRSRRTGTNTWTTYRIG